MRVIAAVLALAISGCSALFMRRVPESFDGRSDPSCDSAPAMPVADALAATAEVAGAIVFPDEATIGGAVVLGLAHLASGAYGIHLMRECKRARREHDETWFGRAPDQPRDGGVVPFACTVSLSDPSIGACGDTRDACNAARAELVEQHRDMSTCRPSVIAVCLDSRCYPTLEACERGADSGGGGSICQER